MGVPEVLFYSTYFPLTDSSLVDYIYCLYVSTRTIPLFLLTMSLSVISVAGHESRSLSDTFPHRVSSLPLTPISTTLNLYIQVWLNDCISRHCYATNTYKYACIACGPVCIKAYARHLHVSHCRNRPLTRGTAKAKCVDKIVYYKLNRHVRPKHLEIGTVYKVLCTPICSNVLRMHVRSCIWKLHLSR